MSSMFTITGRYHAVPPPADWREILAGRLGSRPRRIGAWAELALFGALECLADAGENLLPAGASIFVSSRHGPADATREVYAQARDDLPMPLLFLQTQPSQMLAVLAAHIGWSGNASFTCNPQPEALLRLAAAQSGSEGLLLGWVEENNDGKTAWLRLRPVDNAPAAGRAASVQEIFSSTATHLRIASPGLEDGDVGRAAVLKLP
jgi:hypothetical protein